jgi:hypothetical protein
LKWRGLFSVLRRFAPQEIAMLRTRIALAVLSLWIATPALHAADALATGAQLQYIVVAPPY